MIRRRKRNFVWIICVCARKWEIEKVKKSSRLTEAAISSGRFIKEMKSKGINYGQIWQSISVEEIPLASAQVFRCWLETWEKFGFIELSASVVLCWIIPTPLKGSRAMDPGVASCNKPQWDCIPAIIPTGFWPSPTDSAQGKSSHSSSNPVHDASYYPVHWNSSHNQHDCTGKASTQYEYRNENGDSMGLKMPCCIPCRYTDRGSAGT